LPKTNKYNKTQFFNFKERKSRSSINIIALKHTIGNPNYVKTDSRNNLIKQNYNLEPQLIINKTLINHKKRNIRNESLSPSKTQIEVKKKTLTGDLYPA
jgi:hypothetical protein